MACTWDDAIDAKCRTCARDYEARIEDLEAGVAAGKRAAEACKIMSDALIDAWRDALQALDDLRRHPGDQAAMDHADAVMTEAGFGIKRY